MPRTFNVIIKQEPTPANFEENYFGVEWISTEQLTIDRNYQRPTKITLVKTIAEGWDWKAVRTLAVSLRQSSEGENYYAVVDGQQRLTAAREANIQELPCQVYIDLSEKQEAELFLKLNNSMKVDSNDLFRAQIAQGTDESKLILQAVRDTGWELDLDMHHVSAKSANYAATAIHTAASLVRVYRNGGILHLRQVLNILHGWYGQHLAASADMLTSMSNFLLKYGKDISLSKFTEKLAQESPDSIMGKASQVLAAERTLGGQHVRTRALEKVLVSIYNKGLKPANRIGAED